MDVQSGFLRLKACLQEKHPEILPEIDTLEARFLQNERSGRLFGDSENLRNERSQIIYALSEISLRECSMSFVDLCQRAPHSAAAPAKGQAPKGSDPAQPAAPAKLFGTGQRWAVIVGVNTYEDAFHYGNLNVCAHDARAMAAQLQKGGFSPERMHILIDEEGPPLPTKNNVLASLKAVADATQRDDLLLFYYSGHGDTDQDQSYLVARDGRERILADSAVSLQRVKQIMEGAEARAKIIILDACHAGANIPGKGALKMTPEFIQRVFQQAEGLAILASCKQHEVSYEWQERQRSLFTHYLLDALSGKADLDQKGFVTVQDANRHVSDGVRLWASSHQVAQTPTLENRAAGDIILVDYGK